MTVPKSVLEKWLKGYQLELSNFIDLGDELKHLIESTKDNPPSRQDGPPPDGAWRDLPPTNRQLRALDKAGIDYAEGITRGEASDIIKGLFARRDKGR